MLLRRSSSVPVPIHGEISAPVLALGLSCSLVRGRGPPPQTSSFRDVAKVSRLQLLLDPAKLGRGRKARARALR